MIVNEQIQNECREPRRWCISVDNHHRDAAVPVSNFNVPERAAILFSRRALRAHSSNEYQHPAYDKRVVFVSWFTRGRARLDNPRSLFAEEIAITPGDDEKTDKRSSRTPTASDSSARYRRTTSKSTSGLSTSSTRADTAAYPRELTGAARGVANFR